MKKFPIEIAFAGDAMLGRLFNGLFQTHPLNFVWGNAIDIWKNSDLFVANLETTITRSTEKTRKTFNYKLNPEYARVLTAGRINYLSLANNHILDFGIEGLAETEQILSQLGITHAGTGFLQQAMAPVIYRLGGLKIAFLSAADHYSDWAATNVNPGIWYVDVNNYRWDSILAQIKKIRPDVDLLVVSLHWGPNWQLNVNDARLQFANALSQAGVDIIHGHSAHHLQPMERLNQTLVMYSLGSLIDDYAVDESYRSDLGAVVKVGINQNGQITYARPVPIKISEMQVNQAVGKEAEYAISRLSS